MYVLNAHLNCIKISFIFFSNNLHNLIKQLIFAFPFMYKNGKLFEVIKNVCFKRSF